MSLSIAARIARLLAVRDQIDAGGGGALHFHGGTLPPSPDSPAGAAPLVIVALSPVSFALDATLVQMSLVPPQGFVAVAGQITWARYVSGIGSPVYDCTVGPPASGAEMIVTRVGALPDGTPATQVYTGGEINVTHTIVEP